MLHSWPSYCLANAVMQSLRHICIFLCVLTSHLERGDRGFGCKRVFGSIALCHQLLGSDTLGRAVGEGQHSAETRPWLGRQLVSELWCSDKNLSVRHPSHVGRRGRNAELAVNSLHLQGAKHRVEDGCQWNGIPRNGSRPEVPVPPYSVWQRGVQPPDRRSEEWGCRNLYLHSYDKSCNYPKTNHSAGDSRWEEWNILKISK